MSQTVRIGLIQHNPVVGDVETNREQLWEAIETHRNEGVDLFVTPELALLGYPPRDLLHHEGVIAAQQEAISWLTEETTDSPPVLLGAAVRSNQEAGPPLNNAALVLADGELAARYDKRLLPTYDVFDEHRYFAAGTKARTTQITGATVGLTVCEDAWHDTVINGRRRHSKNPLAETAEMGADIIITPSASPFSLGKPTRRLERFVNHAKTTASAVVFVNQVGANDDLIFDGNSFVIDERGTVIHKSDGFTTETAVVDVPVTATEPPSNKNTLSQPGTELSSLTTGDVSQLRDALTLGIRDYFEKTGFKRAIVGMSGGIDSSVATALAVDALGSENVHGVTLPSGITATQSVTDAQTVANRLGIEFDNIPISDCVSAVESGLEDAGLPLRELTKENIQARIRGDMLMALANDHDALVLTPDNKSEAAVGYCTLYGDTVGALAPLGDCYKTQVYELADSLNEQPPKAAGSETEPENSPEDIIPDRILEKPPTAELRADQTDEDDLPAYDVLDPLLNSVIEHRLSGEQIHADFPEDIVRESISRLAQSEFKRQQSPPVLRISKKAFGQGWEYPIAASYKHLNE